MAYIIDTSSGQTITVQDGTLYNHYGINLIGRNYPTYGQVVAKTQIDLLDNFAGETPPENDSNQSTSGQLWYDTNNNILRVYDGDRLEWKPLQIQVSATELDDFEGQKTAGTAYFNTNTGQFYVHDGSTFRRGNTVGQISTDYAGALGDNLGNPGLYGTTIRNIYLTDSAGGTPRAVLALIYKNSNNTGYSGGEKIVALFSGHPLTFDAANALSDTEGETINYYSQLTESGGIGISIKPGMNLRQDAETSVGLAALSSRAEVAYKLNVGLPGNDGANIDAGNVFHSVQNNLPDLHDTRNLGAFNRTFAAVYATDLFLGNGSVGTIQINAGSNVDIGTISNPVSTIFVENLSVTNGLDIPSGSDIGTSLEPVGNIYVSNVYTDAIKINDYYMPRSKGTDGQQMYVYIAPNGNGFVYWNDPISNISDITVDTNGGIIETITTDQMETVFDPPGEVTIPYTASITTTQKSLSLDTAFVKGLISIADDSQNDLAYDSATGEISFIKQTDFDSVDIDTFVRTTGDQNVGGIKTFTSRATFNAGVTFTDIDSEVNYGTGSLKFTGSTGSVTFASTGTITASGDITAFSDRRLKDDLKPIENALEKVNQLSGCTFVKKGEHKRSAGLIAQDLLKVLPEVVTENDDGMLSVAYGNTVALLVEAIKELKEEVEQLKRELGK